MTVYVTGTVAEVFAHRFIIATHDGTRLLADLGPKGLEAFPLQEGMSVEAEGERKPSELKVANIRKPGGAFVAMHHPAKPEKHKPGKDQHGKDEHGKDKKRLHEVADRSEGTPSAPAPATAA